VQIKEEVERETVADIFVRINSEGQSLTASDFILTWLSVFWEEGRTELENWARSSRFTPQKALAQLKDGQAHAVKPLHWDEFLKLLERAGFRNRDMVSSRTTILYTYALWIIGRVDFKVPVDELREVMARWYFMAAITGRYTNSPETRMQEDLNRLAGLPIDRKSLPLDLTPRSTPPSRPTGGTSLWSTTLSPRRRRHLSILPTSPP
jgi:hypothetical protein